MGSNGHTANRTPTATTRQPLPSGATEYRLSTLPRHHSCSFCAPSTNVDAGAAIHSLTRCVASCTPFVLRLTCDCPSVLAPSRPYPLVHSHHGRRRIHHGANIATIGRATTIPPLSLYIYAAKPSDKPLPLSPLFKPCPSQTQGAPPTHTRLLSCARHSGSTPNTCLSGKDSVPCHQPHSSACLSKLSPLSLFLLLASGEQPACYHHIANYTPSNRNCLLLLATKLNPCPSDTSHSLDEQLDCRPSYR
jgi:hypothetical protein